MLKKVLPIVISLCLIFSISAMAENETPSNEDAIPEASEQIPQGAEEQPQGGRGNMGTPPYGGMRGGFPGNMQNNNQQTQETEPMTFLGFIKTYSTPITSVILLALAFIFVVFYRRKNY